jgi:hypothetical protein
MMINVQRVEDRFRFIHDFRVGVSWVTKVSHHDSASGAKEKQN